MYWYLFSYKCRRGDVGGRHLPAKYWVLPSIVNSRPLPVVIDAPLSLRLALSTSSTGVGAETTRAMWEMAAASSANLLKNCMIAEWGVLVALSESKYRWDG